MSPPLVLVDPPRGPFWPLAATRPAADLLAGTRTFLERWTAREGAVATLACDAEVADWTPLAGSAPPANRPPPPEAGWSVARATWVPPDGWSFGDGSAVFVNDGTPVAWRLDSAAARSLADSAPTTPAEWFRRLDDLGLEERPAGGIDCDAVWSTMHANPALIVSDAAGARESSTVRAVDPVTLVGDPADLVVGPDATIGAFVLLDVTDGPIVLGERVRIEAHAALRGPLYLGPDTVVLGGEVGGGASFGPACKVRGEIESTIVQGYANKAHDGFVGHSVLGAWTNLGAGTITSDLKNTYGPVRVEDAGGVVDTGLLKAGSFLGDHVRTGIGTLLTTGCRLGAGSHVFGGGRVMPRFLPEFSWYDGERRVPVRWDAFARAAGTAMERRGRRLEPAERAILKRLHEAASG